MKFSVLAALMLGGKDQHLGVLNYQTSDDRVLACKGQTYISYMSSRNFAYVNEDNS